MNEVDVCVVGGGLAGSTAVARASQLGLRAVLLEKSAEEHYLCNSRMTAGVFHLAVRSILDPPAELEKAILSATHSAQPAMAHALASDAERAVRWLQSIGVRFIKGSPDPHHNFVVAPPANHRNGPFDILGRGGDVLLGVLHKAILANGGTIRLGCAAKELIVVDGACKGVVVETTAGDKDEVRAKSVIIADGGFQTNHELIKRYGIVSDPAFVVQRNSRTDLGDGLQMALAAGARASDMLGFYGHLLSVKALDDDRLWPYPWLDLVSTAGIAVGRNGHRFADESRGGIYLANKVAALQPSGLAFAVFDQPIWDGPGRTYLNPPNPRLTEYEGTVFQADTLQELACKLKLPADALRSEVDGYNNALENGTLGQLSPTKNTGNVVAYPIKTAPFYGVPMVAGITYTMGGIATDENCRALHADGTPFVGLFAAGCAMGGAEGGEDVGYVGGLVKSAVTGLRAAEFIVNAAKSDTRQTVR